MRQYLLDTSISQCYISEVTIAELTYGAYKSNRVDENLHLIDRFVSEVQVVPFAEAIGFYAQEKNRLRALGTPVEDFDLLIAASARARDLILVTDNVRHFQNISGLEVENWVER